MGILDEQRFPLTAKQKLGIDRHADTLKSWINTGLKSRSTGKVVKLEAIYEGKHLVTSREAIKRFLAELNGLESKGARKK